MTRNPTSAYIALHHAYTTRWNETVLGAEFDFRVHDSKRYYAIEPGTQYGIRVHLPSGYGRKETIVSVDGRDVLKNEAANFEKFRGLVTGGSDPFVDVKGWRISDTEIKVFVSESLGYGLTTSEKSGGSKASRGAIGAAIFGELAVRRDASPRYASGGVRGMSAGSRGIGDDGSADGGFLEGVQFGASRGGALESMSMHSMGGASLDMSYEVTRGGGQHTAHLLGGPTRGGVTYKMSAPAPAPSVGTKAGHTSIDKVGSTSFNRDGGPTIIEIEYDSLANLIARGIFETPGSQPRAWAGMPHLSGPTGFCDKSRL